MKIFQIIAVAILLLSCQQDDMKEGGTSKGIKGNYDPVFEEALVNRGIDEDGIVNKSILTTDANKVTEISIDEDAIKDFTGIELFTNLTSLRIRVQDSATLNLNQNQQLKSLAISGNSPNVAKCSIDWKSLPNLRQLELFSLRVDNFAFNTNLDLETIILTNVESKDRVLDLRFNTKLNRFGFSYLDAFEPKSSNSIKDVFIPNGDTILDQVSLTGITQTEFLNLSTKNLIIRDCNFKELLIPAKFYMMTLVNISSCKNLKVVDFSKAQIQKV